MDQQEDKPAWADLSYPVQEKMVVWPGAPQPALERLHDMGRGDSANSSAIRMSLHTGTHIDAPLHFIEDGEDVASMPLSIRTGPAKIIEVTGDKIRPEDIANFEELYGAIREGERVFVKTRHSDKDWTMDPFIEDYIHFSTDAVKYLIEKRISVLGIDYLSVGGQKNNLHVHQLLLSQPVWIIEGLDLRAVKKGLYEAVISPVKIVGGEASPVSVLVRPIR